MDDKKLEKYAVLDAQIKLLVKQKDELKIEIIEKLIQDGEKTVDTQVGKFTIATLRTWTYTPKVAELEEAYKAQKATEEICGEATCTEKPSLRFVAIKF